MNSMFGVLRILHAGSTASRWGTDHPFGQFLIKLAAEQIEKEKGYDVIYGDTDSLFLNTG